MALAVVDRPPARDRSKQRQGMMDALLAQADEVLAEYDETDLECRDLRHSWVRVGAYRSNGLVRRELRCQRGCGTTATDSWYEDGRRVSRRYHYEDHYLLKGKDVAVSDVRRQVLRRVDIYESEEQMIQSLMRSVPKRKRSQ